MYTCADEHDVILAILCFYFIHHYLGELIVHICFDYDWSIVNGVDRIEHGWVASGKSYDFIRKVLGCIKSPKRFAWALWRKKNIVVHKGVLAFKLKVHNTLTSQLKHTVLTVPGRG